MWEWIFYFTTIVKGREIFKSFILIMLDMYINFAWYYQLCICLKSMSIFMVPTLFLDVLKFGGYRQFCYSNYDCDFLDQILLRFQVSRIAFCLFSLGKSLHSIFNVCCPFWKISTSVLTYKTTMYNCTGWVLWKSRYHSHGLKCIYSQNM